MKNFNYNTKPNELNAEEVLIYRKKRLHKQQIVFGCIFAAVMLLLLLYVGRRVVYTYYDGYVKLDQNHIRAVDDVFVLKIYKRVGDEVQAGDTLYSYVLLGNLLEQHNVNATPDIVADLHRMQIQAELARTEIPVLKVKLAELDKRLKNEENDVYYGLTGNTEKLMLQAERKEIEAKLKEQYRKIALYQRMSAQAADNIQRSGYGTNFLPNAPGGNRVNNQLVMYACAPQDAVVTDVKLAEETVAFREEGIMDLQHSDYAACNLGVVAYIPSNKVKYINKKGYVEVIVNDDITLKAKLSIIGVRVEQIPKHLLSNFSHDVDAVIAYFTFTPGQQVPFWVLTDNLPVRVRTNNFQIEDDEFASRILEIKENNRVVPADTIKKKGGNR
ncbi:HlyD family secretion protein [Phocaeicola plebeius]|jgi:hypothetical protein